MMHIESEVNRRQMSFIVGYENQGSAFSGRLISREKNPYFTYIYIFFFPKVFDHDRSSLCGSVVNEPN